MPADRPSTAIAGIRRRPWPLLFWIAATLLAWELCRRSLTLGDEGYMLSQAADLAAGKLPYRDFDLFVTPGAWLLNALVFVVAGPGVIATRVVAGASLLATMAVSKRIAEDVVGGELAPASAERWGFFAAALVAVFAVWAFPAWTISFYSPYASLASLCALACLLRHLRAPSPRALVACGVFVGVAAVFKQNYGAFAGAGCAVALLLARLLERRDRTARGAATHRGDEAAAALTASRGDDAAAEAGRREPGIVAALLRIAAGVLVVLLPGIALLAIGAALPAAVDSILVRPFGGFAAAHSVPYLAFEDLWQRRQVWSLGGLRYMSVPMMQDAVMRAWPSRAILVAQEAHSLLYWLPPALVACGFVTSLRRARQSKRACLAALCSFAAVFFLGVFPRADFNHLINVWQPLLLLASVLLALAFGGGRWRSSPLRRMAAFASLALVTLYSALAAVWFAQLLASMSSPLAMPRGRAVLVSADLAHSVDADVALLGEQTAAGEPVFALSGLSMIPFLAARPMPTRFYNYLSVHIGQDQGRAAAAEIVGSGARVLLMQTFDFFADSEGILDFAPWLAASIRREFRPAVSIEGRVRQLWRRREQPLDWPQTSELWPNCEIADTGGDAVRLRRELVQHALWQSMTSASPSGEPRVQVTRCRLHLEEGMRLRIAADLAQGMRLDDKAAVEAELWISAPGRQPWRAFREHWIAAGPAPVERSAGEEHAIELEELAGQDIAVELRAKVDRAPLAERANPFGLAVAWSGGWVESPLQ